jgi:hypothetical protein
MINHSFTRATPLPTAGSMPVKVSSAVLAYDTAADSVVTMYGGFFYPHALDWNTKQPLRYIREMFRKTDSLGMVLIVRRQRVWTKRLFSLRDGFVGCNIPLFV